MHHKIGYTKLSGKGGEETTNGLYQDTILPSYQRSEKNHCPKYNFKEIH
jgi:hypothetical protein